MANKKITQLPSEGSPSNDDVLAIVNDPGGSPETRQVTVSNLMGLAPVQTSDLGTAASKNVGTSNGNVVELDATGLPAIDGSQLTNLPSPVIDVDTPLNTALRGTDNPHIGAYPNQSFKVIDNPSKSVMLGSDTDGKLYVFNSSGKSAISTGISAVEDSAEPDIEITTTTGTYSLITGDSDTKDPNGLPIQQGFNAPNIGAFSSPLLISGGSIA